MLVFSKQGAYECSSFDTYIHTGVHVVSIQEPWRLGVYFIGYRIHNGYVGHLNKKEITSCLLFLPSLKFYMYIFIYYLFKMYHRCSLFFCGAG